MIRRLAAQLYPGKVEKFMQIYEDAVSRKAYGQLLVDCHVETDPCLRLRTDILNQFPAIYQEPWYAIWCYIKFINLKNSKRFLANMKRAKYNYDLLNAFLKASPERRKLLLQDREFTQFICDCCSNFLCGNIRASPRVFEQLKKNVIWYAF